MDSTSISYKTSPKNPVGTNHEGEGGIFSTGSSVWGGGPIGKGEAQAKPWKIKKKKLLNQVSFRTPQGRDVIFVLKVGTKD